jgi:hypothetical protein
MREVFLSFVLVGAGGARRRACVAAVTPFAPPALLPLEKARFGWTTTRCSARHNAKAVQVVISGTSTFALPGALNKRD